MSTASDNPQSHAEDLYRKYTSTSALAGVNHEETLRWSCGYFAANFGAFLPLDKQSKILDIGCGYGKNLRALSQLGYSQCHGVDISAEQISYARDVVGLRNVESADVLEWLQDKQLEFDMIIVLDVLEHLSSEDLLYLGKQIYSALKPGGVILVQVPNGTSPMNPFVYGDLTHLRAFTPQSLQQFFLYGGLEPITYKDSAEHLHGFKSTIKAVLWKLFLKPALRLFATVLHGTPPQGHFFSPNLIAVARKS